MERIVTVLVITTVYKVVRGRPIHNAVNLRLNPIFVKEDNTSSLLVGGVFSKILPEGLQPLDYGQDFSPKSYIPNVPKRGVSCANQIGKVLFPENSFNTSYRSGETYDRYLKIPIISQPFSDYKIIVATAPWNMRISGSDVKPIVIYLVFPEDSDEQTTMNVPEIYFVKRMTLPKGINKKDKIDPLIIVDNNRMVTGLKSKTVSKFIKFKNKLHQ